jgi:myo-inositol 2-dehydrogenase / D-chiro-inositol 1-dehydrogenase
VTISNQSQISRRSLLQGAAATIPLLAAGASFAAESPAETKRSAEHNPSPPERKIKLGVVGNGGRGSWIAGLFKEHGGYEMHAVADYFQPVADKCGEALGVDKSRRFSGLSGYKKVIESGVEALAVITPPYFISEMAATGVEAGLHVYMAKPVAIDVPGCLRIGAAGKQATEKHRVFLIDYQIPTDPHNIEVCKAVREGKAGKFARVMTTGISGGRNDPRKTATIESRLQNLIWDNDIALGGGLNVSYDIHAIDAAIWLIGQRPLAAMGGSQICRPNPHGDRCDVASVVFEYADGLIHEHFSQHLPNHTQEELSCKAYSYNARAFVDYWTNALFQIRGVKPLGGPVTDLYAAGAKRNIGAFYRAIVAGHFENATAPRAVDGTLTAILGREAAVRHGRLTMEGLLKENKRIEPDLTGLRA